MAWQLRSALTPLTGRLQIISAGSPGTGNPKQAIAKQLTRGNMHSAKLCIVSRIYRWIDETYEEG